MALENWIGTLGVFRGGEEGVHDEGTASVHGEVQGESREAEPLRQSEEPLPGSLDRGVTSFVNQ